MAVAGVTALVIEGSGWPDAASVGLALAFGGALLASAYDVRAARRTALPDIHQQWAAPFCATENNEIRVTVHNRSRHRLNVELEQRISQGNGRLRGLPVKLSIPAGYTAECTFCVRPFNRGNLALDDGWLYLSGPLGLWEAKRRLHLAKRMRVGLPKAMLERFERCGADMALATQLNPALGQQQATPLVIWLDTGMAMNVVHEGRCYLDHAVDAALALAVFTLAKGVAVAVHVGGAGPWQQPRAAAGDAGQLPALAEMLQALRGGHRATAYAHEASQLLQRYPQRADVIFLGRLPANEPSIYDAFQWVASRHSLLVIDIIDQRWLDATHQPLSSEADARAYCTAVQALGNREQISHRLAATGVNAVQVSTQALPGETVRRYAGTGAGRPQAEALNGKKLK